MMLISKHREYYDCMLAVYGRDPHLVYDRRGAETILMPQDHEVDRCTNYLFAICNREIHITWLNGHFYMPNEKKQLEAAMKKYHRNRFFYSSTNEKDKPTEVNKEKRKPVLMRMHGAWFEPMHLADFGLVRYYPAQKIYEEIVAFLGWLKDHPEPPEILNDKQKTLSRGFDLKKSFRHRKG